jgi:hypothetical protein
MMRINMFFHIIVLGVMVQEDHTIMLKLKGCNLGEDLLRKGSTRIWKMKGREESIGKTKGEYFLKGE